MSLVCEAAFDDTQISRHKRHQSLVIQSGVILMLSASCNVFFLSSPLAVKRDIAVTIFVRCMCVRACVRPFGFVGAIGKLASIECFSMLSLVFC